MEQFGQNRMQSWMCNSAAFGHQGPRIKVKQLLKLNELVNEHKKLLNELKFQLFSKFKIVTI